MPVFLNFNEQNLLYTTSYDRFSMHTLEARPLRPFWSFFLVVRPLPLPLLLAGPIEKKNLFLRLPFFEFRLKVPWHLSFLGLMRAEFCFTYIPKQKVRTVFFTRQTIGKVERLKSCHLCFRCNFVDDFD